MCAIHVVDNISSHVSGPSLPDMNRLDIENTHTVESPSLIGKTACRLFFLYNVTLNQLSQFESPISSTSYLLQEASRLELIKIWMEVFLSKYLYSDFHLF